MKYILTSKGQKYELNLNEMLEFVTRHREFVVDPRTMYVFYSFSPHPFGYATEHLDFSVINKGQYLLFPFSKKFKGDLRLLKDGMIRRYDSCSVKTVCTVKSDDPVCRSWLPLLDPHSLVGYSETVEVSLARLNWERQKLEQCRQYRQRYPDVPEYTYNVLCEMRILHIRHLLKRLK